MIDLENAFDDKPYMLLVGDSLKRLKEIPDNSIDSIVTDPPYGLGKEPDAIQMLKDWVETGHHESKSKTGFLNKPWDAFVPQPVLWQECLRVLKPGGHLLSFAGTRTYDLVVLGLRLSGFEIRDQLAWVYASGMPKSLDVSKNIDKNLGVGREIIKVGNPIARIIPGADQNKTGSWIKDNGEYYQPNISIPNSDLAKKWEGWKSSLKPAMEPIVMARKPLDGTIVQNVLKWNTGALNIDACRIERTSGDRHEYGVSGDEESTPATRVYGSFDRVSYNPNQLGRFPSNFVHDGSEEVLKLFPDSDGAGTSLPQVKITGYGDKNTGTGKSEYRGGDRTPFDAGSGNAARFFYCAKASKLDRHSGLTNPGNQFKHGTTLRKVENTLLTGNNHPTVKPLSLCDWLVKMVTPPNGIVLDPFNGSGSTGKAAILNDFRYIGIDLSQEYLDISEARITYTLNNKEKVKKELAKNAKSDIIPSIKEPAIQDASLEGLFDNE